MKILIGVDTLLESSGISRVAHEMAKSLQDYGHDVRLVCGKCQMDTSVPVTVCRYSESLYQSDIFDVLRVIKDEKPDIFHSHYYPMDICGAMANSSITRHVAHSHGVNHQSWRLNWRNALVLLRADFGEFLGAHRSRKVVAVSHYQKRAIEKKHRLRGSKVEVVYNTVDLSRFTPSGNGADIREKYGIQNDEIVLLCVAALTPRKRPDLLLDCMSIVASKNKKVKLLFVGEGGKTGLAYRDNLVRRAESDTVLKDRVTFCGAVGRDMPHYYAAADIFVSASSWESFGLPFVEAMACGKPVVGFDVSAVAELITSGENGYKVTFPDVREMAERIIRLADEPGLRNTLGMKGRQFAEERFSSEMNRQNLTRIYSQLL